MREELTSTIAKTFHVLPKEAQKLFKELLQCVQKKHLVSMRKNFQTMKKSYLIFCPLVDNSVSRV